VARSSFAAVSRTRCNSHSQSLQILQTLAFASRAAAPHPAVAHCTAAHAEKLSCSTTSGSGVRGTLDAMLIDTLCSRALLKACSRTREQRFGMFCVGARQRLITRLAAQHEKCPLAHGPPVR